MKKLTENSKYDFDDEGFLNIYLVLKSTGKYTLAFKAHPACLKIIKQNNSLFCENVYLIPQEVKL